MPRVTRALWDRVWNKVPFLTDLDACWPWRGALSKKRRGHRPVIQLGRRGTPVVLVTRIVCGWYQGDPPTALHEAGHICPDGEREDCVNPRHLRWQTRVENEQWKRQHARAAA